MENLTLYYFPSCPFCRKVLKFIEKNGLNDKIEFKNTRQDDNAKKELLEIGRKDQVPCLFIDNKPLYESNDIITWLKSHYL
ncbi:glutaredoxin [Iocasia frigidifontis]|uniref:Glutaredoxin n=1 Tax=Iocasia fonsfrigidae TaxID=2682810 RepID=A0A8A7KK96_9FIRM|nr:MULTISPECIES: glutathione S-transferase N-terminal domain-containing protein [Halanaerobiaceae]AZO95400.1 glutaredoxin [Halocella sp. SP3-1]MTI61160.1 glutaredoxin [Bacillota bacterium]QTL98282.1 glutaredoxin [Iocasia fonsfrigidae]